MNLTGNFGPFVTVAIMHLADGSTIEFEEVNVDAIGPNAENKGVIGIEFEDSDRLVHVPFVRYWEIEYR